MTDIDVEVIRDGACTYRATASGLVAAPAWRVLHVLSDPAQIQETFRDVKSAKPCTTTAAGRVISADLETIGTMQFKLFLARSKNTVAFWSEDGNMWADLRGTWTVTPVIFNATCRVTLSARVGLKMAWLRMFPVGSLISSKIAQSYEDLDENWKKRRRGLFRPLFTFLKKKAQNLSRGIRNRTPVPTRAEA